MNPDPLEDLLRAYAEQPLPLPPTPSKATIWREIEQRRRRAWFGIFPVLRWRELFAEPRLAIAGLAVALVIGIVPVAAAQSLVETSRVVRNSLHLDVFTTCPSCLPLKIAGEHDRR